MRICWVIAAVVVSLMSASPALAIDEKTIENRVGEAVLLHERQGVAALCAAATDADGPFLSDEAYVFVFLRDGRLICHPRPDLNAMRRDRSYVPDILANTEAEPQGAWTRYPWPHPYSFKVMTKSTFCRISGPLIVCAGAYFDVGSV